MAISRGMTESSREDADVLVAIGGDGTFLKTAHISFELSKPFWSLGTGRLNFLPNNVSDFEKAISAFLDGNFDTENLPIYRWQFDGGSGYHQKGFFLNDLVVAKPGYDATITLRVFVNSTNVMFAVGDGIIVSTPLGSTGYNLSAGGPIMDKSVVGFCVTPLNAHQTNLRPLILPQDCSIGVEVEEAYKASVIVADGNTSCQLPVYKRVYVWNDKESVLHLVSRGAMTFYDKISKKFGWLGI
jgi:NAD+ kinase